MVSYQREQQKHPLFQLFQLQKRQSRHLPNTALYPRGCRQAGRTNGTARNGAFLLEDEDAFVDLLTEKSNRDIHFETQRLLRELIDHIDAYETEGKGKNRTQRLTIHYRFVDVIDLPKQVQSDNLKLDLRQGVAVEYIPSPVSA